MSTAPLKQAIRSSRAVLDEVKPEHMDLQTPCESWKVRDLVNHIVGAQHFFNAAFSGEAPSGEAPDFASGDFLAAFDQVTAQTIANFETEGALERTLKMPFGEMPGAAVMGLAMTDTFTHAWDLAKSIGHTTDLAPELAAAILESSKMMIQPGFRGEDGKAPFTAEQPAPEGATNADKLAAFLGRKV
jgi:uncharacterized protein (TIGR03086 family)